MGTAYFADKIREFGSVPSGAGQLQRRRNAGAPMDGASGAASLPQEEFIDDIPYPETQNYVKRILGTAEDYRRLYGPSRISRPTQSSARRDRKDLSLGT